MGKHTWDAQHGVWSRVKFFIHSFFFWKSVFLIIQRQEQVFELLRGKPALFFSFQTATFGTLTRPLPGSWEISAELFAGVWTHVSTWWWFWRARLFSLRTSISQKAEWEGKFETSGLAAAKSILSVSGLQHTEGRLQLGPGSGRGSCGVGVGGGWGLVFLVSEEWGTADSMELLASCVLSAVSHLCTDPALVVGDVETHPSHPGFPSWEASWQVLVD